MVLFGLYVFLSLEEIPFCDLKPLQQHFRYFSVVLLAHTNDFVLTI